MATNGGAQTQGEQGPRLTIDRIYLKDASLEVPNSPHVFRETNQPEINVRIETMHESIDSPWYEVVLAITVTATREEKTLFLVEIKQAGLFGLNDFDPEQVGPTLGIYAPNVLFPYAREVISDLVTKAGFPQLLLSPINFETIYKRRQQERQDAASASG